MSELTKRDNKLTRENYKVLGWVAVFAVYAYLTNERLVDATTQSGSVFTAVIVGLALTLITVTLMLRRISLSRESMLAWGLRLDKQGWLIWGVLLVLTIGLAFLYPPVEAAPDHLTIYALNLLNLTSQELILRAFLITYLIRTLGSTKKKVFLAIATSALLTAVVHKPLLNLTEYGEIVWVLTVGVMYGYIYYSLRSIILFMYFAVLFHSGNLVPNAPQAETVYPLGLALLVYLVFSGACLFVQRKGKSAQTQVKPQFSPGE